MRTFLKLMVVVSILSVVAPLAKAQQQAPADPAAMEAMWKEYATPGEPHKAFQTMKGTWSVDGKDYMTNPASPTMSTGEAKFETVLGGRFLVQHYHSTFQGQPFEGMGITGYDNAKKKFVGNWVDNMGTGIMNTEGTYDPASKTMTEHSDMSSPMGTMKVKMVTKHDNENQFTFTMYMMGPDGKESKSMELIYKRKPE